MIHAYREQYAEIIQLKTAEMFELGVLKEKISIDKFSEAFASSRVADAFEMMDPVFILGKSSNELIGIILDLPPVDIYIADFASPEYWTGWVLGYAQTYFKKSFKTLLRVFPASELLNYYFPYHEMDIMHIIDVYKEKFRKYNPLKEYRNATKLSQDDLSLLTDIPARTIRAYEQGKLDLSKAQADTVLVLAKTLGCSYEDLIY